MAGNVLMFFKLRKPSAGLVAQQSEPKLVEHKLM